jgi:hypothetical protein
MYILKYIFFSKSADSMQYKGIFCNEVHCASCYIQFVPR